MLICWSASPSVSASGSAALRVARPVDRRARDADRAGDPAAVLAQLLPGLVPRPLDVHERRPRRGRGAPPRNRVADDRVRRARPGRDRRPARSGAPRPPRGRPRAAHAAPRHERRRRRRCRRPGARTRRAPRPHSRFGRGRSMIPQAKLRASRRVMRTHSAYASSTLHGRTSSRSGEPGERQPAGAGRREKTSQPGRSSASSAASPPRANSATERPSAPAERARRAETLARGASRARAASNRQQRGEPLAQRARELVALRRRSGADPPAAGTRGRAPGRAADPGGSSRAGGPCRRRRGIATSSGSPPARRCRARAGRPARPSTCSTRGRRPSVSYRLVRWSIRFASISRANGSRGSPQAAIVACAGARMMRGSLVAGVELALELVEERRAGRRAASSPRLSTSRANP